MNHIFDGHEPWKGAISQRPNGRLVADRSGKATSYAIENLSRAGRSSSRRPRRCTRG